MSGAPLLWRRRRASSRNQPASADDAAVDRRHADGREVLEADGDGRQAEVVERAVLEPGGPRRQPVPVLRLHRGERDGAPREPRPPQLGELLAAGDQAADSGRVAEELVERDGHEIRLEDLEIHGIGGRVGGAVEQDVPAELMRLVHPGERVVHAAEVGLRRVGEQPVLGRPCATQHGPKLLLVHAQVGLAHGHVGDGRALDVGELADAVHRVVVVVGQAEHPARAERVRLADELESAAGVGREDDLVVVLRGVEEASHGGAGLVDQRCRRQRRGVAGVRVAEDVVAEKLVVPADLGLRVEPAAGVVEVRVAEAIETRVVAGAQLVDGARLGVVGVAPHEVAARLLEAVGRVARGLAHASTRP